MDNYNENTYQQSNWHDTYTEPRPGHGFGIASMVLGILALCFFWGLVNIPLGILAIIFAVIHIRRHAGSVGYAVAGIVTSVLSFVLMAGAIWFLLHLHSFVMTNQSGTIPYLWEDDEDNYDDYDYDDGDQYIVDPSNPGSLVPYEGETHHADEGHDF